MWGSPPGDGSRISTSHRSTFRPEEVKAQLGALDQAFADFAKDAQELSRKPMNVDQARSILAQIFKSNAIDTAIGAANEAAKEHRAVAKVINLFGGAGLGSHHAGSAGTAWGLVNAVSEYIDHHAGRSDDTRIDSAWFGKGAEIKTTAMELAIAA